jgi:restriction system protein
MATPTFDAFCRPVLEVLSAISTPMRKADLMEAVADRVNLPDTERSEVMESGQLTYQNRIGWACSWMKHADWVDNPSRAMWVITAAGRARLQALGPITAAELRPKVDPRVKVIGPAVPEGQPSLPTTQGAPFVDLRTPDEKIDEAVRDIKQAVGSDLLSRLKSMSPVFFEVAVLRLLKAMGYAGKLGRVEHSGKTGDGGVDGILYLDRLELERVYVQAKKWDGSVGASAVRDFAGAMDAEAATKGVVITTGHFTADAQSYVKRSPKAIRLVSGEELVSLMIEFAVGVSHERTLVLPKLDLDFFEGD